MFIRQRAVSANGANTATFGLTPLVGSFLYAFVSRRGAATVTFAAWSTFNTPLAFSTHAAGTFSKVAGVAESAVVDPGGGQTNLRVVAWEVVGADLTAMQGRGTGTIATPLGPHIDLWPGPEGPDGNGEWLALLSAAWDAGDADSDGRGTADPPATEFADLTGQDGTPGHAPHAWAADQFYSPPGKLRSGVTMDAAHHYASQAALIRASTAFGSAPRGLSGAPEYVIELYNQGATFGPNAKIAEIWDALTVGWSKFDRIPGKAFFSLPQSSSTLPLIVPLTTHIAIWRITPIGDTLVYRGAVIDTSNAGDDVVVDCYDYISLLSLSRSGFKTLYPTKALGTEIVAPEWTLAQGATSSILGFVSTGTIQDPLATDNVTPIKTNAQFGTLDQTRLQLFYDLTEMGRANTINQVTFEIDLTNTFHFWKNQTGAASIAFVLGGNISDYSYLPGWSRYRNDIATIGVASAGGASEIVSKNAGEITAKGLRQDVTTLKTLLGIAGGPTEADQQKAALDRALRTLYQQQATLALRVARGKVEPFVGYSMNDTAPIEISNGVDLIQASRRIVGTRAVYSEAGEDVDIYVSPIAS